MTSRGQSVQLSADPKGQKFCYANGRTVIMRSLEDPSSATEYTEHSCNVSVAKWAPSGFYIASGDVQGNVRIWDTTQEEHILKITSRPLSGKINDIAWDFESKRLIAVGEGKEKFGHAFAADTANSVGEIIGHSKTVNSCAIRGNRPFRAATAGDDLLVNFYQGPPYKFVKSISDHTRFIQSVRFSPDGKILSTTGSDGNIFFYDGSTGDKLGQVDEAHKGGIYALSWSPDSKMFMTSSGDMTVKFWDAETRQAVNTVTIGSTTDDQQLGNLWAGKHCVSVSLGGELSYLDPKSADPIKTIHGHQKGITAFTVNQEDKTFFTGSYDGRIYQWSADEGLASPIAGKGHTNQVATMAQGGSKVYSAGLDDAFKSLDVKEKAYDEVSLSTEAAPKCVVNLKELSIVVTVKEIMLVSEGKKVSSTPVSYTPGAVAISPCGTEVAVGGEDMMVYLYKLEGQTLTDKGVKLDSNRGAITSLAYSPDGKWLAVADTDRKVLGYDIGAQILKFNQWVFHSARVNCISWAPDSKHAVSGALDRNIYVWSVDKPMKSIAIKGAHQDGVTGVSFLDNDTVMSVGADACVKTWSIKHHQ